jgi:hypothetical protein
MYRHRKTPKNKYLNISILKTSKEVSSIAPVHPERHNRAIAVS